jgi:hypothetical protein
MESVEEGPLLKKPLAAIRVLMDHPPIPVAGWRQEIADYMIRGGRYLI